MKKIPAVNGLRGIGIMIVIVYHIVFPLVAPFDRAPLMALNSRILLHNIFLQNGQLAVHLFFILSGFVLTLPYALGERQMTNWKDVRSFYSHRARRILPLMYVNLAVIFVFYRNLPTEWSKLIHDLFFLFTGLFHFLPSMWFPAYNGVLWSLGIEIWFCALLPFIIFGIQKWGIKRVCIPIFIVSVIVRAFGLTMDPGRTINYYGDNVIGDAHFFLMGTVLAYAWHRGRSFAWHAGLGSALIVAACLLNERVFLYLWWKSPFPIFGLSHALFGIGCTFLLSGLLVTNNRVLHLLFSNRPLQLIGMMSYSLYLWHPSAQSIFSTDMTWFNFIRYIFALFLLCGLSYRYIEFGHRKWRDVLPEKV